MGNFIHPIALYVHWPFCLSKCPYCDFNSHVSSTIDHDLWRNSYLKELEYFLPELSKRKIRTLFFGGGTPSLMEPETVKAIIDWLKKRDLFITGEVEITLEANPTSVETKKLKEFYNAGINRISIGTQSLVAEDLHKLGRTHTPDAAIKAIKSAKSIFPSYSFDLIYARENQKLLSWKKELEEAMKLAGGHISLYQLTIEKGTKFYSMHEKGELFLPENDLAADMYEWTKEYLKGLGYNRYEISNFAIPGHECKHNLAYWNYDEYLGIGPGAHSRICLEESSTPIALMHYNKPDKWLNLVQECGHAIQTREKLLRNEIIEEVLMMGLRLQDGISDIKLKKYLNKSFDEILDLKAVENLMNKGFLEYENNRLKLSNKGIIMHSYIVPRIIGQSV